MTNHLYRVLLLAASTAIFSPAASAASAPSGRPAAAKVTLTLESGFTGETDLEAGGASAGGISVFQTSAKLNVPLPPLSASWFPGVSLSYRHHRLDRKTGTPLPGDLQSLNLGLNAYGVLSPDWTFIGSVSPGIASSDGLGSKGFGLGLLALAMRKFDSDLSAGFGLRYDSRARGFTRILPIATFDWAPAPGWKAFLGFPRTGASWRIGNSWTAELTAEMDFGSFQVNDDPLPAGRNKPALNRTRLEYKAVRVGPALRWEASPGLSARLGAGLVPFLEAEYEQRGYRLKSDGAAGFASLELEWKF